MKTFNQYVKNLSEAFFNPSNGPSRFHQGTKVGYGYNYSKFNAPAEDSVLDQYEDRATALNLPLSRTQLKTHLARNGSGQLMMSSEVDEVDNALSLVLQDVYGRAKAKQLVGNARNSKLFASYSDQFPA